MRLSRFACLPAIAAAALSPALAHASFLSGDTLDAAANALAWVVIIIVPLGGIVLFWLVHVMPEKIAHKRHHPQFEAIKTLCLLSLVFGGLLWPIAWLWAYTKPVMYRMAYGTDKHFGYYTELVERARKGEADATEIAHARTELAALEAAGTLPLEIKQLIPELESLHGRAYAAANPTELEISLPTR